jgi:hypothetical protein
MNQRRTRPAHDHGCVRAAVRQVFGVDHSAELPAMLARAASADYPSVTAVAVTASGEILPLPFLRYRRVKIQGRGR